MTRVMTYNISGGRDARAIVEVLTAIDPDLVCLLEAPAAGRLKTLAAAAGLVVVVRAGRRSAGSAILAHPDARSIATNRVTLGARGQSPRREAAHAIVGLGAQRWSVTAVQLGLRADDRHADHDELLAFLHSVNSPTILGADLNESVRSPVAASLAANFQDAHGVAGTGDGATYPTQDPSTRQDFVFIDRSVAVDRAWVPSDPPVDLASHHRPVVVDIASGPVGDGQET